MIGDFGITNHGSFFYKKYDLDRFKDVVAGTEIFFRYSGIISYYEDVLDISEVMVSWRIL